MTVSRPAPPAPQPLTGDDAPGPARRPEDYLGKTDPDTGRSYPLIHHLEDTEAVGACLAKSHPLGTILAKACGLRGPPHGQGDLRGGSA